MSNKKAESNFGSDTPIIENKLAPPPKCWLGCYGLKIDG